MLSSEGSFNYVSSALKLPVIQYGTKYILCSLLGDLWDELKRIVLGSKNRWFISSISMDKQPYIFIITPSIAKIKMDIIIGLKTEGNLKSPVYIHGSDYTCRLHCII